MSSGNSATDRPAPLAVLAGSRFVLLTTFRKSGVAVPTAVWAVELDGDLWVWTNPSSGKVKRIRNNGRVLVQPCSMRGEPIGEPIEAHAAIGDGARTADVLAALRRKYGFQGLVTQLGIWIGARIGRPRPPGVLVVTIPDPVAARPLADQVGNTRPRSVL